MPIPTSILSPGLSDDTNYALQLDTFSRFEGMKSQMQEPMAYDMPETLDPPVRQRTPQADILSSAPITIGEGLFSDDPKVAGLANQHLQQSLDKRNTKGGAGVPEYFPYDKSMDRFLAAESGYNPYISIADNEQYQYVNDYLTKGTFNRVFSNIGKGFTRFGAGVALKTVQTMGYLGSMIGNGIMELVDGKHNEAMANIADNSLSRWAEDMETGMKNSDLLAVFKPRDWEDKGFFSKLGHGAFWSDEVADGAAFMGEMVLSSYLLGGAGKLAGLGKLGATSIKTGKKAIDMATKFLTGADDIAGVGRWAFLTTSESAMESSQKYTQERDQLIQERNEGKNNYSDDQIKAMAGNAAASLFKDNLMILGASSAFENRMIFGPLFGKRMSSSARNKWFGKKTTMSKGTDKLDDIARVDNKVYNYRTKLGQKLNLKDPTSRLRFYGGRVAGATVAEGYWEENAQLAAERLAGLEFYQEGNIFDRAATFTDQLAMQTKNATMGNDPTASTAIGLGTIIGGGATAITTKVFGGDKKFVGERRQIISDVKESVETLENSRKKFLSFQDIYKREGDKVNENGITIERGTGKVVKDEFGDPIIDQTRAEDVLTGFYNFSTKMSDISSVEDPLFKKFLQDSALTDYVHAAKEVGVFDRAKDAFSKIGTKTEKELLELGFDPNTTTDVAWMNNSIEEIGKIYDEEMAEDKALPLTEGYNRFDDVNRRFAVYKNRAKVETAKKLANEYQAGVTSPDFILIDKDNPITNHPIIHEYNAVLMRLQMLQQVADSQAGSFYDGHFASQKQMLKDKLEELRPSLQMDMDAGMIEEIQEGDSKGIMYQKGKRFMSEVETNPGELIAKEYGIVSKYAQMLNLIAQAEFVQKSFSSSEGARAWQEYKEHMKKVGDESAEADAATASENVTPPKPDDPADPAGLTPVDTNVPQATGKFEARGLEVYDPKGILVRAVATEQEAMDLALTLNQQAEELKKKEAEKAAAEKEAERLKKEQEDLPLTYDELKAQVLGIIKARLDVDLTDDQLDRIAGIIANPDSAQVFTEEDMEWLTEFVKAHNEKMGKEEDPPNQDPPEDQADPSDPPTPDDPANPPPPPPVPPASPTEETPTGQVPSSVLEEVKERFRMEEEAITKGITFEEQAKLEGFQIHHNVINDKVDDSKNNGKITFVTSNPKELKDDKITLGTIDGPIYQLRHNFLAKIANNQLNKADFKISLQLSDKGNIYAVVTDKAGNILTFNEEAEIGKGPMHLEFYLDYDLYNASNLPKRRAEVMKMGAYAPLTGIPVVLHPSFLINGNPRIDVLEILKDRIRQGTVLASIDFALQGLLAREGQDNSYATIPKNVANQTAASLIEKGHIQGKQGDLLTMDMVVNGIYIRGNRLNFPLYRDINDTSKGTEVVEFRATRMGDAVTHEGKRLMDMKVMIGGKEVNFFQAAIDGTLPSEPEYIKLLNTVLRPDKFMAINLGGTVIVVNLKAFKKFVKSENVNAEELRKLTVLDQIEDSELNIFQGFYSTSVEVELHGDILKDGNYVDFINSNIRTSATLVNKGNGQFGYTRFNKRIVITLDDNFEDIMKKNNQRDVVAEGPDTVTTPGTDQATDAQKLAIMDEYLNKAAEDIEDDLTDTKCK